jgi:hypothetical protein
MKGQNRPGQLPTSFRDETAVVNPSSNYQSSLPCRGSASRAQEEHVISFGNETGVMNGYESP